jgi:prepilin signal peptidase PulO-like enzyme (type II secretory pathway)
MVGFLIAVRTQVASLETALNITPLYSIYSSIYTYILCFGIALAFYFRKPYAFGGGDVKLLSAVAAFAGFEALGKMLVASFLIMAVYSLLKKKKSAPLAPFIFASFLLWLAYTISTQA